MMNLLTNRQFKRFLILVAFCSVVAICTSAIALATQTSPAPKNSLQGISAVDNAPAGVLDSVIAATLKSLMSTVPGSIAGHQVPAEARLLPRSISGRRVYLIPSTTGDFCMFVEQMSESCTSPLNSTMPALFSVVDLDGPGGTGPIVFGVAENGAQSISFTVEGKTQTVPVSGNVFEYQADPSVNANDISDATAILANGLSVSLE